MDLQYCDNKVEIAVLIYETACYANASVLPGRSLLKAWLHQGMKLCIFKDEEGHLSHNCSDQWVSSRRQYSQDLNDNIFFSCVSTFHPESLQMSPLFAPSCAALTISGLSTH